MAKQQAERATGEGVSQGDSALTTLGSMGKSPNMNTLQPTGQATARPMTEKGTGPCKLPYNLSAPLGDPDAPENKLADEGAMGNGLRIHPSMVGQIQNPNKPQQQAPGQATTGASLLSGSTSAAGSAANLTRPNSFDANDAEMTQRVISMLERTIRNGNGVKMVLSMVDTELRLMVNEVQSQLARSYPTIVQELLQRGVVGHIRAMGGTWSPGKITGLIQMMATSYAIGDVLSSMTEQDVLAGKQGGLIATVGDEPEPEPEPENQPEPNKEPEKKPTTRKTKGAKK